MVYNLSAVQNLVELRSSGLLHNFKSRKPGTRIAAIAVTMAGCLGAAGCTSPANHASYTYKENPRTGSVVAVPMPPSPQTASTQVATSASTATADNHTGKPAIPEGKSILSRSESNYSAVGLASWYGPGFHGRRTADGERFDSFGLSAAHKTMPLPSYARVTNVSTGTSIVVRVNDRGPYIHGRLIDVSSRAAELLDFKGDGVGKVKVEYVGRAPEKPVDTNMLLATLRTDGAPAQLHEGLGVTSVASAASTILPAPTRQNQLADARSLPVPTTAFVPPSIPKNAQPDTMQTAQAYAMAPEQIGTPVPVPPLRPQDLVADTNGSVGGSVGQANARTGLPREILQPDFIAE